MSDFMIRFLICNVLIGVLIGMLLVCKRLFGQKLTGQMQYCLWFPLLSLLAVPFIPIRQSQLSPIFSWLPDLLHTSPSPMRPTAVHTVMSHPSGSAGWMEDFSVAVSQQTPSGIGFLLCVVWILGGIVMTGLFLKSLFCFHRLKKSALPLQNPDVRRLYNDCLKEMHITKDIPIYSAAFLKSPVMAGWIRPCIYLPIHLISDYRAKDIRYMLLHELWHYRHKDALANYLMSLAGILYWFHPLVRYALKEMKNDREIACDASVLHMLQANDYADYGNTLINFAEQLSRSPFPFVSGIHGGMAQMQKRILNIARYHPASVRETFFGWLTCILIAALLFSFVPVLSIQAADQDHYAFLEQDKEVSYLNLDALFGQNSGSFVLYDATEDSWQIYRPGDAKTRISPASTYKIYDALFGLEAGVITPEQSLLPWDGQHDIYEQWNKDQTLASAMQHSVTWYFQALDRQAGFLAIQDYLHKIGYGNQQANGSIDYYWADSTLKISPIEQIEMLRKFYDNQFDFAPENIEAVKKAICLSSTANGSLYGKTGTRAVNGQNVSGWFIGFLETNGRTYFFSTNIQNDSFATGPIAAELTFSILSDLGLWD